MIYSAVIITLSTAICIINGIQAIGDSVDNQYLEVDPKFSGEVNRVKRTTKVALQRLGTQFARNVVPKSGSPPSFAKQYSDIKIGAKKWVDVGKKVSSIMGGFETVSQFTNGENSHSQKESLPLSIRTTDQQISNKIDTNNAVKISSPVTTDHLNKPNREYFTNRGFQGRNNNFPNTLAGQYVRQYRI